MYRSVLQRDIQLTIYSSNLSYKSYTDYTVPYNHVCNNQLYHNAHSTYITRHYMHKHTYNTPNRALLTSTQSTHTNQSTVLVTDKIFVTPVRSAHPIKYTSKLAYILTEAISLGMSFYISNMTTGILYNQLVSTNSHIIQQLITDINPIHVNLFVVDIAVLTTLIGYYSISKLIHRYIPLPLPSSITHTIHRYHRWSRIVVIVGVALVADVLIGTISNLYTTSKEEPLVINIMMSADPLLLLTPVIIGPINEELIFRVMLFARLLRTCGPVIAYTVSSSLFGIAHVSNSSEKLIECTLSGIVMASSYHITKSIYTPIMIHIINNGFISAIYSKLSIYTNIDERYSNMCVFWSFDNTTTKLSVYIQSLIRHIPILRNTLPNQIFCTQSGKPTELFDELSDTLFDILDYNNSDVLNQHQLMYLMTLDHNILEILNVAWLQIYQLQKSNGMQFDELYQQSLQNKQLIQLPQPGILTNSTHINHMLNKLTSAEYTSLSGVLAIPDTVHRFTKTPDQLDLPFKIQFHKNIPNNNHRTNQQYNQRVIVFQSYLSDFIHSLLSTKYNTTTMNRDQFRQQLYRQCILTPQQAETAILKLLLITQQRDIHPLAHINTI